MGVQKTKRQKLLAKSKNKRSKQANIGEKTLADRLSLPVKKGVKKGAVQGQKDGFRVINGKLVSASDVGLLLREIQSKNAPKKAKFANRERKPFEVEDSNRKQQVTKSSRPAPKPYGSSLYVSLSSQRAAEFLRIRNLPIGTDSQALIVFVEKLSPAKVLKMNLVDLPSGSGIAELWFEKSSVSLLRTIQRKVDRANVDGRVVFAEIASTS
ncbi:LAMI_0B01332g1_1 [Lachancea mirantina]|uniref:LAMI_0B01332g1_1 n=1 Tax=Lachancea mirantina TaxID=1230905 RepID=A0A1G4ITE4_9SACH|nr:LAMI_0B01332g1_1 [Lachancea mirantina]